jgi:predicted nucleic acid-binding protein
MDFADATLVHLAARESIETILTVDQTAVYRITGKRRFRVHPLERP